MWTKRGNCRSIEEYLTETTGQTLQELRTPRRADPGDIENIAEASLVIRLAIKQQKSIWIVGDYDVDGITATAMLVMLLEYYDVNAKTIIPKRFSDGYGINERMVNGIRESLIITVDNGIAAKDAIGKAKDAGNTVLILDHHLPESELPCADVICDPHIHPEANAFTEYCGAGLVMKLAEFMTESDCGAGVINLMVNLTVLAAIGTLGDVMPLLGDNRRIVMEGLKYINDEASYKALRPGIRTLLKIKEDHCDEETIKFRVAPILNAPGRLYDAGSTSSLKAVLSRDDNEATNFVEKMLKINDTRKELVQKWLEAAIEAAEAEKDRSALILKLEKLPEGICGIIAGKLAEEYKKVTFVFTQANKGEVLKASGRSALNIDISPMLAQISRMTVSCGGHAGAAGLSVSEANYDELKSAMLEYMDFTPVDTAGDDAKMYDCEITEEDIPEALEQLKKYAPYGEGINRPVFLIRDFKAAVKSGSYFRLLGKDGSHLKIFGSVADAIGFGMAEDYEKLGRPTEVNLLGDITENIFRGQRSPQFSIKEMCKADE